METKINPRAEWANRAALKLYNIDDRKEETILDNVRSYELSANREKVF